MAVGTVVEIGDEATRFHAGNRVFGHFPIRGTQTVLESNADLVPEGLSPEAAVCLDPLVMALARRDAGVKLGDRVTVFGLGAIGFMAVQLTRITSADWVVAVVLDPFAADGDMGVAIRLLTGLGPAPHAKRPQTRVTAGYWERLTQTASSGAMSRSRRPAARRDIRLIVMPPVWLARVCQREPSARPPRGLPGHPTVLQQRRRSHRAFSPRP